MREYPSVDSLLQKLEDDSVTNREKADILTQIIDIESEKSKDDADMDLIEECFEYLETLLHDEAEIAARKEQLPSRLQFIYQKAAEENISTNSQLRPATRKRRIRTIGVVAAVFISVLLVSTSLTVIARVNGYENMWEWISTHLNEIFQLNPGEEYSFDGITIVRDKDTVTYPNLEAWLKEERWDILYPSVLPEGIKIERILQSTHGEGETRIMWAFNTPNVRFTIQNYDLSNFEATESTEIVEANGYYFSIVYLPEIGYQAFGIVGDFAYSIECAEREALLTFINNLKGIEE